MKPDLPRTIGFWGASGVMVGVMIGSGIFRTPAAIADQLGSPWVILLLWVAGGVLSLFGALTYSELACMHPESGGVYVFLREGYGRCLAFVFGWTYMLITKPLAAAGIAVVFSEHVLRLFGVEVAAGSDPSARMRLITIGALVVLTAINVRGMVLGAGVALVLTLIKVAALSAIVVLGLAIGGGDAANLRGDSGGTTLMAALTPVMFAILWTYDGWSDVGAIAGEVRDPQRRLPLIYLTGTAGVMVLYLGVNAVYMWMMPLGEMRNVATVAPWVMDRLVGPAGGVAVTALVVISTLGSTHGSIMTGGRVTFAQSRDGLLFAFLSAVHPRYHTPAVALWVQLALSCAAVWFVGTFEKLAGGFVFTMWIFYGLAGAAVFILRARRPDAPRPYRCWGYPVVPAVFVAAALGMTVLSIIEDRDGTLPWLAVLAAGVPAYVVWSRLVRRRAAEASRLGEEER